MASVTKIITATTLMQLHAQGKFNLDDDVNGYLPFELRNPNFPGQPITFAQLLRHRSSIRDNRESYMPLWTKANGDPDTVLGEYLQGYLELDGELCDKKNFFPFMPGADSKYCNTCYALLGYLAERISGRPFQQYTQEALLNCWVWKVPRGLTQVWTKTGLLRRIVMTQRRGTKIWASSGTPTGLPDYFG